MSPVLPSFWPVQNARRLPAELLDYVLDFLHEDKPSLRSCSLVARAFVASSQLHLFRTLSCGWEEDLGYGYVVPFFKEHPYLKPYVRSVYVVDYKQPGLRSPEMDRICLCSITDILSTFPRLRVFTMGDVSLDFNTCCSSPPAHPFTPIDIVYLDLVDIMSHNTSLQHLVKLLKHFKDIQSLHIVNVWLHREDDEVQAIKSVIDKELAEFPSSWSPPLAQLTISGEPEGMLAPFAHLLTTCDTLRDLEELNIACFDWTEFDAAATITRGSNKGLLSLKVDVAMLFWSTVNVESEEELLAVTTDPGEWKYLGLSSFKSLRIFETSVKLFEPWSSEKFPNLQPSVRGFQLMLDFLSEVPRSIEDLTIFLRFERQSYIESISQGYDWGRLMSIIYSFPGLTDADIILLYGPEASDDIIGQCQHIVLTALRPFTKRKKKSLIRVAYEQGNYNDIFCAVD